MRVILLSISDRPSLSKSTFFVLRQYCEKHGYDLDIRTTSLDTTRHIAWSKILLLVETLDKESYDYCVWIDDDILITDMHRRIESFITSFDFDRHPSKDILLSMDVVDECPFNTGFLIVKNTTTSKHILSEAWNLCEKLDKHFEPNWEQDALIHFYKHTDASPFLIVPHNIVQSFYRDYRLPPELKWSRGDFAAHITGMPLEKRLVALREIMMIAYPSTASS